MGSFFSNVSILKDSVEEAQLKKHIVQYMKKKGFRLTDTTADNAKSIIFKNNPNSKWFTIYEDESDDEQISRMAASFAKKFKACATVAVGHPYDIEMNEGEIQDAHGKKELWQPIARNVDRLLEAFTQDYIFSEEVITTMEEELGICYEDVNISTSELVESKSYNDCLFFISDDGGEIYITEGDTILNWSIFDKPKINNRNMVTLINRGGISKGLAIIITGSCFNQDSIEIDEIQVERAKNPREPRDNWYIDIIVENQKTMIGTSEDGQKCIYALFPDFEFPEGINSRCKTLTGAKLQSIEFNHQIVVRYTPKGNKDINLTGLYIIAQPRTNTSGSTATYH